MSNLAAGLRPFVNSTLYRLCSMPLLFTSPRKISDIPEESTSAATWVRIFGKNKCSKTCFVIFLYGFLNFSLDFSFYEFRCNKLWNFDFGHSC